jgi:hypothetical protein
MLLARRKPMAGMIVVPIAATIRIYYLIRQKGRRLP